MMLLPILVLLFSGFSASLISHPYEVFQRRNGDLAPLYGLDYDERIPDEYIVSLRDGHTHERHFEITGRDLSKSDTYTRFSFGYTMNLSDSSLMDDIRRDPGVLLVEPNRYVHLIDAVRTDPCDFEYEEPAEDKVKRFITNTAEKAPYGLQMLAGSGKLSFPINNSGNYDYISGAGRGVNVYILDSGIRITHRAFQGRARNFGGLALTDKSPYCADTMDDTNGHGTHVAGTIGARTYGVAPAANLINVKIANNDGQVAEFRQIAQAILDVVDEHNANKARDPEYELNPFRFRGSIINMSFGWEGFPDVVQNQLIKANEAGIRYAAAGNQNINAANTYPCANPQTDCIAAIDDSYTKGWFSNYGSVVSYVAPGDEILSLGIRTDSDLAYKWGTSMATARASGASAIFTSWQGLVDDQTKGHYGDYVWWNSISGLASGLLSTKNLIINTGIHSKKKRSNEPFRWADHSPPKNHEFNETMISVTPAATQLLTTLATVFSTATVAPLTGLTTQVVGDTTVQALTVGPSLSALGTVTFTFDPPTSTSATSAATE